MRGDRASCLTVRLGRQSWLLAVARGFGSIDGTPIERALLARLRQECERRIRGRKFRRAVDRPREAAAAMLSVVARVNSDVHARTASHDDYVTAAASLTAVFAVRGFAYVLHSGTTAAYLIRNGIVTALTDDDALHDGTAALLPRALGTAPTLEMTVSNVRVGEDDVVVLLGRRIEREPDAARLLHYVEFAGPSEHVLLARFERDDALGDDVEPCKPRIAPLAIVRIAIAALLALALVLAR
jgi:hypothetical protein